MARKSEKSEKTQRMASAIAEDFQKVLVKHGIDNHAVTGFSLAPTSAGSTHTDTVLNCPPHFHKEWVCRTVNGVTTCGWECVPDVV